MRYMLLIYGDESRYAGMTPEELAGTMPEWAAYSERYAGVFIGGEALEPTPTATTVRVRDGRTLLTDGPFAETREQLGGYYLMECESLDQALQVAADCPEAPYGSIEVRPVMVFPE